MTAKAAKPALIGTGTGLGNVVSWQARDVREHNANLSEIQQAHIAARFGLAADRARLVASLAWGSS